jgi:hypothetical protein
MESEAGEGEGERVEEEPVELIFFKVEKHNNSHTPNNCYATPPRRLVCRPHVMELVLSFISPIFATVQKYLALYSTIHKNKKHTKDVASRFHMDLLFARIARVY